MEEIISNKKALFEVLIVGLVHLIKDGSNKAYWFSTRSVADAVLALNTCLTPSDFLKLRSGSIQYLIDQAEQSQEDELNWMEEIWDTAIALIALSSEHPKYDVESNKAYNWLCQKYLKSHTSWNEEVWETLLALNAVTKYNKTTKISEDKKDDHSGSAIWLMKMIDTPNPGMLINWSSTALFILCSNSPSFPGMSSELKLKLKKESRKCAEAILNSKFIENDEVLWTAEAWSNGLILWALAESKPGTLSDEVTNKVIKWFQIKMANEKLPIEDRSFSCIGIFKYLVYLELHEKISNKPELKQDKEKLAILNERISENLQIKVSKHLNKRISDYELSPPIFTQRQYSGYYSFHVRAKLLNIFLICLGTVVLSFITLNTQYFEKSILQWVVLIPVIAGALATLAQLANFNLMHIKSSKKNE